MKTILLLLISFTLFSADTISLEGLSPEQAAAIKLQVASAKPTAVIVREEATAWVQIGQNVGQAMLGAAKEIGVAAADFAQTPLGVTVVVLIVFKMFGAFIIALLVGVGLVSLGALSLWYVQKRILQTPTYEVKPVLWGMWTKRSIVKFTDNHHSSEMTGFLCAVPTITMIIGAIFLGIAVSRL